MDKKQIIIKSPQILLCLFILSLSLGCKTAKVPVEYIYEHELRLPPKGIHKDSPTLVLLHGYGSNERDLLSLAQHIPENGLVVCPRGPIVLAPDKYSWYPLIIHQDRSMDYKAEEVQQAAKELLTYLSQLIEDHNIDSKNIFLGGFSQGGIMSMALGLRYPEKVAGIICLSGKLYFELEQQINYSKSLKALDVFVSHGEKDTVLPISEMKGVVTRLESKGMDISENWYPSTHTISNQNFKDMLAWLAERI